jgi:hypothetical protein
MLGNGGQSFSALLQPGHRMLGRGFEKRATIGSEWCVSQRSNTKTSLREIMESAAQPAARIEYAASYEIVAEQLRPFTPKE